MPLARLARHHEQARPLRRRLAARSRGLASTERYSHPADDHVRAAAGRISGIVHAAMCGSREGDRCERSARSSPAHRWHLDEHAPVCAGDVPGNRNPIRDFPLPLAMERLPWVSQPAKCTDELSVACCSWVRAAFGALDDNVAGSNLDAGNEMGTDKDTRRQTPKNTLRGVGWQGYRLGNLR